MLLRGFPKEKVKIDHFFKAQNQNHEKKYWHFVFMGYRMLAR